VQEKSIRQIAIPLEMRGVQEKSIRQIAIPLEMRGVRSAYKPTCWSPSNWMQGRTDNSSGSLVPFGTGGGLSVDPLFY
jgi:hypothetical protein